MRQQIDSIALTALLGLAPLLLVLLGSLATRLHALINAKVKNTTLSGILNRLDDAALVAVQSVEQTVVSKLDPSKPLGDNAAAAKAAAITELKTHLGQKGLDEIKSVLGIDDTSLDQVLVSYIESKVHVVNQGQQVVVQQQAAGGAK